MRQFIKFLKITILLLATYGSANADVNLKDIHGTDVPWASLAGKWVFINYWASWCGPCVDEINEFNQFYATHTKNIAMFAVNFDAPSLAKQQRLATQFNIQYPSLNPQSLRTLHLGDISVVPVTYVFDPQGQLVSTLYGGQTRQALQAFLG